MPSEQTYAHLMDLVLIPGVDGAGHSEELLGQSMKGRRDRFIVATKIGWIDYDR